MIPLFGRTQYRRGAVVFTLKHTFLSVGLESLRFVVTTSENGPEKKEGGHLKTVCLLGIWVFGENIFKFSLTKYTFLEIIQYAPETAIFISTEVKKQKG